MISLHCPGTPRLHGRKGRTMPKSYNLDTEMPSDEPKALIFVPKVCRQQKRCSCPLNSLEAISRRRLLQSAFVRIDS